MPALIPARLAVGTDATPKLFVVTGTPATPLRLKVMLLPLRTALSLVRVSVAVRRAVPP